MRMLRPRVTRQASEEFQPRAFGIRSRLSLQAPVAFHQITSLQTPAPLQAAACPPCHTPLAQAMSELEIPVS